VRVEVFLRHLEHQLGSIEHVVEPGTVLSAVKEQVDLRRVLAPVKEALAEAVARLELKPDPVDLRQHARAVLYVAWANLSEMSPERLRRQWSADDVPEAWAELQHRLLIAVETAITELG